MEHIILKIYKYLKILSTILPPRQPCISRKSFKTSKENIVEILDKEGSCVTTVSPRVGLVNVFVGQPVLFLLHATVLR